MPFRFNRSLLNLGIVYTNSTIYSCFSITGTINKFISFILGSNFSTVSIILLPIESALTSLTGKKSISPKLIPNLGFKILSPGEVVNKLIKAFLIAPTFLSETISLTSFSFTNSSFREYSNFISNRKSVKISLSSLNELGFSRIINLKQ